MSGTSCIDKTWLEEHQEFLVASRQALLRQQEDRAHPYPPGSGPAGQNCGTCAKLRESSGFRRKYFKCSVMKRFWTRGSGTDIRKKDPACLTWEPRVDKFEVLNVANRR